MTRPLQTGESQQVRRPNEGTSGSTKQNFDTNLIGSGQLSEKANRSDRQGRQEAIRWSDGDGVCDICNFVSTAIILWCDSDIGALHIMRPNPHVDLFNLILTSFDSEGHSRQNRFPSIHQIEKHLSSLVLQVRRRVFLNIVLKVVNCNA